MQLQRPANDFESQFALLWAQGKAHESTGCYTEAIEAFEGALLLMAEAQVEPEGIFELYDTLIPLHHQHGDAMRAVALTASVNLRRTAQRLENGDFTAEDRVLLNRLREAGEG